MAAEGAADLRTHGVAGSNPVVPVRRVVAQSGRAAVCLVDLVGQAHCVSRRTGTTGSSVHCCCARPIRDGARRPAVPCVWATAPNKGEGSAVAKRSQVSMPSLVGVAVLQAVEKSGDVVDPVGGAAVSVVPDVLPEVDECPVGIWSPSSRSSSAVGQHPNRGGDQ